MTANELRIGNYIGIIHENIETQATADHIKWISEGDTIYKPIPLTEEWLLKFGFFRPFVPPVYEIVTHSMDKMVRIHKVGDNTFVLGNYDATHASITQVHQLQNIYFALTGQELTLQQTPPEPRQ